MASKGREQKIETVVIGGGQAGLSASYYLKQQKRDHLVLERSNIPGNVWKTQRWDSFTLVSPNWSFQLPGAEYHGTDPNGFMPRDEVVRRFEEYVSGQALPINYGVEVNSVAPSDDNFLISAGDARIISHNVIIATGLFQRPKVSPFSAEFPAEVLQISASDYRRPDALPPGAVLVVGSGQSGCQIAEELNDSGRKVYLSVGKAGRLPRRYRGRDGFEWLDIIGFISRTTEMLPSPAARFGPNPHLTGKNGGHTINLNQFYKDGIGLLGHLGGIQDGILQITPDLFESLAKADKFEKDILEKIDKTILKQGFSDPPEELPVLVDGFSSPILSTLDIKDAGITAVIWACGFAFDFGMVKFPVFDDFGFPVTQRGKTRFPGLFFLGMPWLYQQRSGLLLGVGDDAACVADEIAHR